jgi:TRAP-type C4-dicarboxylate transport system permease small subunit
MENQKVKKVLDYTYNIVRAICTFFLIAEICITSVAVAGRFIPFIPDPAWSEEMTLTCMIYMSFISAALAIRKKTHIRMTSFDRYLPKQLVRGLDVFDDILVLFFSIMMVFVGFPYAIRAGKGVYVSLTWLSKFWLYAPIPISGIAMIIFQIEVLIQHIYVLKEKGEEA